MARLLMNMIMIKHGFTVALIRQDNRNEYLNRLEQADKTEDLTEFINYIASCCEYALNLFLRAARGEPIDDIDDINKEIALFRRSVLNPTGETFSAIEHLATVLHHFYQYCLEKILLLSEDYFQFTGEVNLIGMTIEGKRLEIQLPRAQKTTIQEHSGMT